MRSRRMTLQEVARKANVSLATASLALNNHPRVAAQTRQRVTEVAERLGFMSPATYAARRLARSRRQSRSTSFDQVGLIYLAGSSDNVDQCCLATMRGAEHELSPLGACLVFVRVSDKADWEKVRRLAHTGIVDGWLIIGAVDDAIAERMNRLRLPWVILGDHYCTGRGPVHCVNVDHAHIGRSAAEYLAGLGHRRVAFVGASMLYQYQKEIFRGFREAVRDRNLDSDERLFHSHELWNYIDHDHLQEWMRDIGPRPTAIFCGESGKTAPLLQALSAAQIRVPDDISVIGCDASEVSTVKLNFTRLDLPVDEVGMQGARLLHKIVTDGPRVVSSEVRLAATFHDAGTASPLINEK